MAEENKNLMLARRAREEGNTEDAKKYYDKVRDDDPDNAEAKFFYSYYKMMDGTQGQSYINFINLCNTTIPTIKLIVDSSDSEEEKEALLISMINSLSNALNTAYRADNNINGGHYISIKQSYKQTMESAGKLVEEHFPNVIAINLLLFKSKVEESGRAILANYAIGDEIEKRFADSKELMDVAVLAWKKGVSCHVSLYNTKEAKENVALIDKYVEKIKKYDPNYTVPQKPGCISFKDPSKVN